MSGDTYNQPAQPSYGEGMADALKAQVQLLTGTGDFRGTGSLESLLPLEESIRKKTAQTDTDILRQTLLGGEQGTYTADGKILEGYDYPTGAEGSDSLRVEKYINVAPKGFTQYEAPGGNKTFPSGVAGEVGYILRNSAGEEVKRSVTNIDKNYGSLDEATKDFPLDEPKIERNPDGSINLESVARQTATGVATSFKNNVFNFANLESPIMDEAYAETREEFAQFLNEDQLRDMFQAEDPGSLSFTNTGETKDAIPRFKKNSDGTDFVAPEGSFSAGESVRAEDGMVDLLGDKRAVTGQRQDFAQYVKDNTDLQENFQERRRQGDTRTIEEFGKDHYEEFGKAEGRELPRTFGELDRQAGFDADGNFLGLSAYAEDLSAGNLSRQRERDLLDVARLSGTYQDIMEDYKPGTQEALADARGVLQAQRENLTGAGAIDIPTDSTFGGKVGGQTFDAATMDDAINLQAGTTYDPSLVSEKGLGYEAVAGLQGGQLLQNDPVRAALMKDAEAALGQGLTDREQRQIAEAARARSTMMGRTFDQSGAIAEAEARVAEDNARRMQNRAFAQSALGQEAGFQESDLGRALQAGIQNQAAQNRAGEFTAGQTLASRMANQAASNQASQFGVQAGMGQEQSEAQLNQARLMANQQAQQQASAFGAESAQQGAIQDARNLQQANQFQQSTTADAQRLNEQLKQSGTLGYIDAASRLAALEDQSTLDPFQAVLGRGGGQSLQAGQSVFGQAGYGLNSGPQYLNPEAGLGFIQNQAVNAANMYGAQVGAEAAKTAGLYSGLGSLGGGLLGNAGLFGG